MMKPAVYPFGPFGSNLCWACTAMCCTNVEPPLLTRADALRISAATGRSPDSFSERTEYAQEIELRKVKERETGECIFLGPNKKCEIYADRPIDCILYPLDLRIVDGRLMWIVYQLQVGDDACALEKHPSLDKAAKRAESQVLPDLSADELFSLAEKTHADFSLYRDGAWRSLREVDLRYCQEHAREALRVRLEWWNNERRRLALASS